VAHTCAALLTGDRLKLVLGHTELSERVLSFCVDLRVDHAVVAPPRDLRQFPRDFRAALLPAYPEQVKEEGLLAGGEVHLWFYANSFGGDAQPIPTHLASEP
jgi:hypothetical protein